MINIRRPFQEASLVLILSAIGSKYLFLGFPKKIRTPEIKVGNRPQSGLGNGAREKFSFLQTEDLSRSLVIFKKLVHEILKVPFSSSAKNHNVVRIKNMGWGLQISGAGHRNLWPKAR